MTLARLEEIRLAAGLPPIAPDEAAFSDGDATAFAAFGAAGELFGEAATLQLSRVMGSSLARVAEAVFSLYIRTIEIRIREAGGGELALAQANLEAVRKLATLPPVIQSMLRWHLQTATRRFREGRDPAVARDGAHDRRLRRHRRLHAVGATRLGRASSA